MKKFTKASELMWLFGVLFVSLGVAICKKADLGVSMIAAPAFIIFEAVQSLWSGFSIGVVEYLLQGVILIIMCLIVQRFHLKYILAFLTAVIYGYCVNLWFLILGTDVFNKVYLRWIMLIVGDITTSLGVACFFRTYLPLEVYELVVAEIADRYNFKVNVVKYFYDAISLIVSVVLALTIFGDVKTFDWSTIWYTSFHSIGLGTIVTTIINAPIIAGCGKLLDSVFDYEPLFPKIKNYMDKL